jgi:hypothetical protein
MYDRLLKRMRKLVRTFGNKKNPLHVIYAVKVALPFSKYPAAMAKVLTYL